MSEQSRTATTCTTSEAEPPTVICPDPTARWFTFGPEGRACCEVEWDGHKVEMWRSPTGRSFRVWVDGAEVSA